MSNNVVLICLDSVRKREFDKYAPRLRKLADIEFDQCRAGSSWSIPSHATMLTGKLPYEHGVHTHHQTFKDLDNNAVLTERIPHKCISISANQFTSETFGWDKWFDETFTISQSSRFPNGIDPRESQGIVDHLRKSLQDSNTVESLGNGLMFKLSTITSGYPIPRFMDYGGNSILNMASNKLNKTTNDSFIFMNLMEAHIPHHKVWKYNNLGEKVPNSWSSDAINMDKWNRTGGDGVFQNEIKHFRTVYNQSIDYLDKLISSFIKKEISKNSETVFIITADHGENLGYDEDDKLIEHTASLSEGLLHVPLVINSSQDISPKEISHTQLPGLIESLCTDSKADVDKNVIKSELIGSGRGEVDENDNKFWDRAQRTVYDFEKYMKIIWDSEGNKRQFQLNPEKKSWQQEVSVDPEFLEFAIKQFSIDINDYKDSVKKTNVTPDISESTKDQLKELGYM
ncbi:sulfatase-like hydrolase/transferase [Haladaptatus pallidirubidus]|uniref:sulfatase-like hydrolase/transferase n=1 Tax=Haladaptatus pallidirubidus TaxID=1008152 RepID=UPI0035E568A9